MKSWSIIRFIIFTIIGAVLIFLGQRFAYQNQIIPIQDVPVELWLGSDYTTAGIIMFITCVASTTIWYVLTATKKFTGVGETNSWQLTWWLLGLLPLASIALTVFFINRSKQAQISLMGFFLLDALLLFWLPTATSSPESVKYVPPGAFFLRHNLMGD